MCDPLYPHPPLTADVMTAILAITNTMFRLPTRTNTTWMHPCSGHWHLIDYVITRAKDRRNVPVTKAMCGADCCTDHRLVISKLNFSIQPKA